MTECVSGGLIIHRYPTKSRYIFKKSVRSSILIGINVLTIVLISPGVSSTSGMSIARDVGVFRLAVTPTETIDRCGYGRRTLDQLSTAISTLRGFNKSNGAEIKVYNGTCLQ